VARQFEGIYLQMMLKSMREASLGDPLFDSAGSDMYRDMYDNQMALQLTQGKGLGLAELLVQQLRHKPSTAQAGDMRQDLAASAAAGTSRLNSPPQFTAELMPLAKQAASELGTTPEVILAQAALESGWGKHVLTTADGNSSYNLFNIKADPSWSGKRVTTTTTEFSNGVARREHAAFRAYDSYEAAFDDYVKLIKNNPRYEQAVVSAADATQYAQHIHAAGYATDPAYASKWLQVLHTHFTAGEG
jgi:peptidoglycan hydrolase FlgJ